MAGKGLLAAWLEPATEREDEFNRWYETEHLAERMAVPGFLNARRYVSLQGEPKYVALYELTEREVLHRPAYQQIARNPTPLTQKVTSGLLANIRNEYELVSDAGADQAAAPYAFLVRLETDSPGHDEEMVRWYEGDHLPALTSIDGVTRARLYRAVVGSPKFLAIYELMSPEIQGGPAWREATDTAWTVQMRSLFRNRANNLARLITALP